MDNATASPRRRGRAPSLEKRQAILQAAIRLLAEKGGDGGSTREIADLADTTERTLFKHFGSKAALNQAAIEEVSIEFMRLAAFSRIHDPEPFTITEFRTWHAAFVTERIQTAVESPDSYRIVFSELLRDQPFTDRYTARWSQGVFTPLAAHLKQMQQRDLCSDRLDAEALASVFFALNLSYLLSRFALAPGREWKTREDLHAVTDAFAACCGWPPL